ncbi:MAG: hypothetical protein IJN46_10685 [Lachnospiraceae bacterium]|nr:hypothetical protein [Lachnospiraceae bacterium]
MKRIKWLGLLLTLCMMCTACGTKIGTEGPAGTVGGTVEAPETEVPGTEEPTTEELTTAEPTTEEPTTEETTTEEPTTEEQPTEPVNLHTEETQVTGEGIVQVFETGKTVVADLDGDGTAERITVKVDLEASYYDRMSMQIEDIYFDSEEFNRITGYMEGAETKEFYLVDLDVSDQWLEIAFFEYGPSNDPVTTFLRYGDGNVINIGNVPTGPPDEQYVENKGINIPGDGTMTGRARYDIVQTSFVTKTWRVENLTGHTAAIEEIVPEYYQFRLRIEGEYQMCLRQDTVFYKEMNGFADEIITLPKDTVVDISRFYPDSGWLQLIYDQGAKSMWLKLDENEMLQPLNVHRWNLSQYIAGLSMAD